MMLGKAKKGNVMYFNNYLNYVEAISQKDNLTKKEKEDTIYEAKELFIEIANISDKIINAKYGIDKYNSQEEYTAVIISAIDSASKINDMYKKELGSDLFDVLPKTSVEIYDLSRAICKELAETDIDEE